ncbi:MAG TPA: aminoglycoside phosphotransferase family protein [Pyrinomonadaceae bacterium]
MINTPSISTAEDFERHFSADFWHDYAGIICRRHNISVRNLQRSNGTEHIVFFIDDSFVIKIYTPFRGGFGREKTGLEFARDKTSLTTPEILFEGEIENFQYLVLTRLEGVLMSREIWLGLETLKQFEVVSQLSDGLRELHSHDAPMMDFDWQKFIERQAANVIERQKACGANPEWLERLPDYLEESLPLLPENSRNVFLHGDVHFGNLRLIETGGKWRISGLFDFADSLKGFHEYDFLAVGVLMIQGQGKLQREFFRAYGYAENEIDETLRRRLMLLTILYECSDLRKYALRLKPEAIDLTLDELERAIWNFCV